MDLFLKGMAIGLAISIPMGPIALLSIHRVISHRRISGLMIGTGSIVANLIFYIIAIYGLVAITSIIEEHHTGLSVFGGTLLLYIALHIFFSKTRKSQEYDQFLSMRKDFATGFVLAITNPLTLIALIALLAWFGLKGSSNSIVSVITLFLGFKVGLIIWWFSITGIANRLKKHIDIQSFKMVNQIFGALLFLIATLILVRVL